VTVLLKHVQETHRAIVVSQCPGHRRALAADTVARPVTNAAEDVVRAPAVGPGPGNQRCVLGPQSAHAMSPVPDKAAGSEYVEEAVVVPQAPAGIRTAPVLSYQAAEAGRRGAERQAQVAGDFGKETGCGPVGVGKEGEPYNINADTVAGGSMRSSALTQRREEPKVLLTRLATELVAGRFRARKGRIRSRSRQMGTGEKIGVAEAKVKGRSKKLEAGSQRRTAIGDGHAVLTSRNTMYRLMG